MVLDKKYFKENLDYKMDSQTYIFRELEFNEIENDLDKFKYKFKTFKKLYSLLIDIVSPVLTDNNIKSFLKTHLTDDKLAFNIGSGNSYISDKIYNIDIHNYDNVDIVCDATDLPLRDGVVDIILRG